MKRASKIAVWALGTLLVFWGGLTLWVEQQRPARIWEYLPPSPGPRALILYNPDPLYDLDRQVGSAFAEGLQAQGWEVRLATLGAQLARPENPYDLYVFCANTYNWAPDRPTTRFIGQADWLAGSPVVAITLGSGSTARSRRLLEEALVNQGAKIVVSNAYWLMRPNDELRMDESNVQVACEMARALAGTAINQLEAVNEVK